MCRRWLQLHTSNVPYGGRVYGHGAVCVGVRSGLVRSFVSFCLFWTAAKRMGWGWAKRGR